MEILLKSLWRISTLLITTAQKSFLLDGNIDIICALNIYLRRDKLNIRFVCIKPSFVHAALFGDQLYPTFYLSFVPWIIC